MSELEDPSIESAALLRRMVASSGKLAYGHPIVIHNTSVKHIQVIPFYIPRSNGTDLSLKVEWWDKNRGIQLGPMHDLSLSAADCRALYRMLSDHLEISKQRTAGDYIVLRLDDGAVDLTSADPTNIAASLVGILSKPDIAKHLTTRELGSELLLGLRSVIRYWELKAAVDELRANLDCGISDEHTYQQWCNQHSWAFGNAYFVRDTVRNIAVGDQVDALLPSVRNGLRDILELKRPDMPVLLWDSHRNFYFSQDVSKAIGQCHRYLDVLHDEAQRGLRDHPEVAAYHPRAIIVIGRSCDWNEERQRALHGLNCRLHSISVMAFDHLLAQCDNALQLLSPLSDEEDEQDRTAREQSEYDSEPPDLRDSDAPPEHPEGEGEYLAGDEAAYYSLISQDG